MPGARPDRCLESAARPGVRPGRRQPVRHRGTPRSSPVHGRWHPGETL